MRLTLYDMHVINNCVRETMYHSMTAASLRGVYTTDRQTYTLAKSAGTPGVLLAMSVQTLGNKHKPAN